MSGPSYFFNYPLVIAGGAFLTTTAVGILAGAVFFGRRNLLLALFGGLGITAACIVGDARLPHGPVTRLQVGSLAFAIAVEMALIPVLRRWLGPYGERTLMLGILGLVGAHFLLMAPAFGPLIVLLGLLAIANAWIGLKFPAVSFRVLWLADGGLKLAVGALMWLAATRLPAVGF